MLQGQVIPYALVKKLEYLKHAEKDREDEEIAIIKAWLRALGYLD